MASFGGSIKLTGADEYRNALKQITQKLRETGSELTAVTSRFDKNDSSLSSLKAKTTEMTSVLSKQNQAYQQLKSAYDSFNTKVTQQAQAHDKLVQEYDKEKQALENIRKASGESSQAFQNQQAKVNDLATAVAKSSQNMNENEIALSRMKTQLNQAEVTINKTTKEIDELGNQTEDSGKQAEKGADGYTTYKNVLANLGTQAINVAISGLKKLGQAFVNVGKQAISNYAEYEQLVGGVETLFKDSADQVIKYSETAYKTAGLSANDYMSTITSFSASLLQSLDGDTKKAVEYSNRAITDMADNANKMGTNISMIQNAYQGFAKQNYTMLDNLKLGYGGTKTEMQRLISDASKLTEVQKELNVTVKDGDISFGNIVNAISVVQKQMGIMGTTSKEADSTIQGSLNSMKSAWQNLLTGVADDTQDMKKLTRNFVDSVSTSAKNLVPRIKQSVDGIKKLINSIVKEVFPKLKREIPELKPLIEVFEWFIKNKSLVVTALKAIVGAFVVTKVASFTKSLSDVSKGLIDMVKNATLSTTAITANTTAQVASTTATKALTTATTLLNNAWKANPIGLIVAGVTTAIGIFSLFKDKTEELTDAEIKQQEALEKQTRTIEDNKQAWDDLKQAKQNTIDAGMTELNHYQTLYDELKGLVDQNGKVKKGYEERASFITSTLADALGIEINKNKDLSYQIKQISKSIDEVIEKKKAQIIIDSQESLYAEAITKQQEALKNLNDAEDNLSKNRVARNELEKQLSKAKSDMMDEESLLGTIVASKEVDNIQAKIDKLDEETANYQTNYDTQLGLLQEYAYNIGVYEQNMELAHAGEYDKMTTTTWNYVKNFQKAGDAEKAQLEDQIKTTETNLNLLKDLKKKSGTDIYDSQIKASEKLLAEQKESLKKYNEATEKELNKTSVIWSDNLDDQLSELTGSDVDFKDAGNNTVQMYIDGFKAGEPKTKEEMAKIVDSTLKEITSKNGDAKSAGENLLDGVNSGVKNQSKQNSVFKSIMTFGHNLLSSLKRSLKENSPSKATEEMGEYLMEGLGMGIKSEEKDLNRQISGVGKNILASMNDELSQTITVGSIKTSSSNNYNSLVGAFKEALSEMKIELDDETVGRFVETTVANAVYN